MTTSGDVRDSFGPTPPPGREVPARYSAGYFWLFVTFGVAVTVGLIYGMWQLATVPAEPEQRSAPADTEPAR